MPPQFKAIPGAQGFQQSNPSVLATASLIGSLQVFHEAGGMAPLRERSLKLTGHLDALLKKSKWWISPEAAALRVGREDDPDKSIRFTITTPSDPASRGSQLSLLFLPTDGRTMPLVMSALAAYGVIGDSRKPDVIRLAPTALYNTMEDVERAAEVLEIVMHEVAES
ncbi:hypothetical protein QCA50_003170 [Cerrena zonata]|uniref:Aminotransferase class V domain-containing protein n=1 Tax=Cerrena zonata TaxID=2478898 RepID=A0AAW0GVM7_9APHY